MAYGWPAIILAYPVLIPAGIRTLAPDVQDYSEDALQEIAEGLVGLYKQEIIAVGAVDTRFFLDTVGIRFASRGERQVASDAFYSGIVEHGWIWRARGQDSYPGRFPAGRAIAQLEPVIEDAFTRQLYR